MEPSRSATYRGFLFADLRDYTSFVESHGDAAASALLDRYRRLVRTVVGQYGGAEIKTEGDSFFVVFATASSAVRCGLEISHAADAATRDDPGTPLRVGVGIHAGETIEGDEGYVGSAVNLAARVCAQARAGDVLATDTVRALTRTSLRVAFTDRGRRRLKGIAEPVQLFLVSPGAGSEVSERPDGISRRWARRRYALPVVIALLLVLGGVGATLWVSATPPGTAPPLETPQPLDVGTLTAGTYATVEFQPPFSFSLGDGDRWWLEADEADNFFMRRSASSFSTLGAFQTLAVYSGPCGDDPTERIDGGSDALLTWFEQHPYLESVNPRPRIVDGITGIQIDVTARAPEESCPNQATGLNLIPLARSGSVFMRPGEKVRFVVVDLPDATVTFDIGAPGEAHEPFLVEADAVIDTIDFVDAGG